MDMAWDTVYLKPILGVDTSGFHNTLLYISGFCNNQMIMKAHFFFFFHLLPLGVGSSASISHYP